MNKKFKVIVATLLLVCTVAAANYPVISGGISPFNIFGPDIECN
ncbi:MAG: hypothetical protein RR906_04965 [Acetivibrio sp.]